MGKEAGVRRRRRSSVAALGALLAGLWGLPAQAQEATGTPTAAQTAPAAEEMGTLIVELTGNRNFCVNRNELEAKPGSIKPRQYRNAPLVTTFGYKYQISASRRGTAAILKLMESPIIRTAYMETQPPERGLPQPRLTTPKDQKTATQSFQGPKKITRWIPESTCTVLAPEYSFPLAAGRYDVYLGFDVLLNGGQWAPLQSDFVTDQILEKGQVTRIQGRVDYTDGVRTVKLDSPPKPAPPAKR